MKERMIYISIILILVIAILFIVVNDKKEEKTTFSEICTKTLLSNGMMDYKSSYVYTVASDGAVASVSLKQDYEFFVEYQYDQTKNNNELIGNYECSDTYKDDHKLSCQKELSLQEATGTSNSVWYKEYKKSLESEGYTCTKMN